MRPGGSAIVPRLAQVEALSRVAPRPRRWEQPLRGRAPAAVCPWARRSGGDLTPRRRAARRNLPAERRDGGIGRQHRGVGIARALPTGCPDRLHSIL